MKGIRLVYLLFALSLVFAGCENGTAGEGGDSDSTEVVKVKPSEQDFPVNKIPDDEFGKAGEWQDDDEVSLPAESNLSVVGEKFPDWLDAIISRESIVLFAQKVLGAMPDEVEFVQSGQKHYQGPEGWRAFYVHFNTRPSNANLVIYGGYQNENKVWWSSGFSKSGIDMEWSHIAPSDNGILLQGSGYYGGSPNTYEFSADLGKKAVVLKRKKVK
jgi:predicted small secreted protein